MVAGMNGSSTGIGSSKETEYAKAYSNLLFGIEQLVDRVNSLDNRLTNILSSSIPAVEDSKKPESSGTPLIRDIEASAEKIKHITYLVETIIDRLVI